MDRHTELGERPSRRARSAIACHRCKHRKQRCDSGFPSCANCIAARHACSYDANVYPAHHVRTLESRIADLEARLVASEEAGHHADLDECATDEGRSGGVCHQALDGVEAYHDDGDSLRVSRNLELESGFVPLSPDAYLGTSSGFPLAKVVQSACSASFLRTSQSGFPHNINTMGGRPTRLAGAARGKSSTDTGPSSHRGAKACPKATMPERVVGERLVQAYLTKVHPKHPFLSPRRIQSLNERRTSLRPCSQLPAGKSHEQRLDYFILHMVYAIGARYLQLVDDYGNCPPEEHYAAAAEDIDFVFDVKTIESLEAMILLVIYQLRSPSEPGIWSIIGVTMRHCLACGLHRKSNHPAMLDQRRKWIFWTAYMLERSIARALGRPYCIADRDIDIGLPANVDDDIDNEADMAKAIEESTRNPNRVTAISPAIRIFRMQQLESKIHYTIYRVDRPISSIAPHKVARLRGALEEWKNQIPTTVPHLDDNNAPNPYVTGSYHTLQYHKAMLLLLLPSLPSLPTSHPDFRLCAYTAGQICQAYKQMHDDQQYLSYSLLALHASFVAGLTMIYCFLADNSIFNSRLSADIRACSTVLYIIAERWPTARKVRNAFERLVRVTVEGDAETNATIRRKVDEVQQAPVTDVIPGNQTDFSTGEMQNPGIMDSFSATGMLLGSSDVWDILGSVLEDEEVNWRWTQEGLYNAVGVLPEYE